MVRLAAVRAPIGSLCAGSWALHARPGSVFCGLDTGHQSARAAWFVGNLYNLWATLPPIRSRLVIRDDDAGFTRPIDSRYARAGNLRDRPERRALAFWKGDGMALRAIPFLLYFGDRILVSTFCPKAAIARRDFRFGGPGETRQESPRLARSCLFDPWIGRSDTFRVFSFVRGSNIDCLDFVKITGEITLSLDYYGREKRRFLRAFAMLGWTLYLAARPAVSLFRFFFTVPSAP